MSQSATQWNWVHSPCFLFLLFFRGKCSSNFNCRKSAFFEINIVSIVFRLFWLLLLLMLWLQQITIHLICVRMEQWQRYTKRNLLKHFHMTLWRWPSHESTVHCFTSKPTTRRQKLLLSMSPTKLIRLYSANVKQKPSIWHMHSATTTECGWKIWQTNIQL